MNKRILYIQHASVIGGSVISLKELIIDAINANFECFIICTNEEVSKVYDKIGAKSIICPVIPFDHNTATSHSLNLRGIIRMLRIGFRTIISLKKIYTIIRRIKPDIVHLNSSTLVLYVLPLCFTRIPIICHIRENIAQGTWGVRKFIIRKILDYFVKKIIYISENELRILRTKMKRSFVIYNYVHKDIFQQCVPFGKKAKYNLISLGGTNRIKGASTLIESMKYLNADYNLTLVGSPDPRTERKEVLYKNNCTEYVTKLLELLKDDKIISRLNFIDNTLDIAPYISSSDLLIFWGIVPHFPRPVYEAWLLKKPVLVYSEKKIDRYIKDENAFLLPDNNPVLLAKTISSIFGSYNDAMYKAENGYKIACEKFTEKNFILVNELYEDLLNG